VYNPKGAVQKFDDEGTLLSVDVQANADVAM
jgi:hypothetical protein